LKAADSNTILEHHFVIPNPRGGVSGFVLANPEFKKGGVRDLLFAFGGRLISTKPFLFSIFHLRPETVTRIKIEILLVM
jgi:hypothetical protein